MTVKTRRQQRRSVRGPRRASWRGRPRSLRIGRAKEPPTPEAQTDAELPPVAGGTESVEDMRARELEAVEDEEDDFADGRSSAGRFLREEEDLWGRGIAPDERPFEESDVPPRPSERELAGE